MGRDQRTINGGLLYLGNAAVEHVIITASNTNYKMKPHQQLMSFTTALDDGSAIVYLPSLVESAGLFYFIVAPTGAAGGDISLYTIETAAELATNGDMDADDDHILLFSTGERWLTIYDGVA